MMMMFLRRIEKTACWLIAIALVIGNLIMLLPTRLTLGLFITPSMSPPQLVLARSHSEPTDVVVFDHAGRVVADWGSADWPIPAVQTFLDRRRIEHLTRIASIALYVQREDGEEYLLGIWEAEDVRSPGSAPLNFVLSEALALPPGRYEVRAMLYADAPWGYDGSPDGEQEWKPEAHLGPARPGQFVLRTVTTEALTVEIENPNQ